MKQNSQTKRVRDSATQALSERLRVKEKVRPREIESQILCSVPSSSPVGLVARSCLRVEETSRRDAVPICV